MTFYYDSDSQWLQKIEKLERPCHAGSLTGMAFASVCALLTLAAFFAQGVLEQMF